MLSRRKFYRRKAAVEAVTAADKGAAAVDHAVAAVNQAVAAVAASIAAAQESVSPAVKTALGRSFEAAEKTRHAVEPRLLGAYGLLSPGVAATRQRVAEDLLPKLLEVLHEAERHPALHQASKRGAATLAALRGELEMLEPQEVEVKRKRNIASTVAKLAAASALLGGAAVAVRQFLMSKDDGWTAHEPSPAYTADKTRTPDSKLVYSTETATESAASEDPTDELPLNPDVTTEAEPTTGMTEATTTVPVGGGDQAFGPVSYGEGSYVGNQPPADHAIKGNERSKKYHVPDSAGYERTIADVWFVSEEAAQAAGFSKAQR